MGHVSVGHHWDRVAMDILDMSVTTLKGNQYVLVMVDCFSRWVEACPLPNKTALAVADAFFQLIVCRFGIPVIPMLPTDCLAIYQPEVYIVL